MTQRMRRPGLRVLGCDGSYGMARKAAGRIGAAVVLGGVRRLPLRDAAVDAVSAVWLLHLVPASAAVVAEAARVLRPGGVFVTTVDKDAGHDVDSDIDAVLRPHRSFAAASNRAGLIEESAAAGGLRPAARTRRTPCTPSARTADRRRRGRLPHWASCSKATARAVRRRTERVVLCRNGKKIRQDGTSRATLTV
ncbi:methyltransferase domain-containing protein [Streptomyces sp. NPDC006294]|uniref:methyltransferase domain-containing protein n=1 Tax=Streptomyces sp. NPDC006294 TaxID=3364743 RepID=UPI00368CBA38